MRVTVFIAAATLLLSGCGSGAPKEPKPTAAPAPVATPSVPTMPPEAKEDSKAGAIAFVKHYVEVFNYASNTGDVKELQRLSDPSCKACTKYISLYSQTYSRGGYFKDSDWELSDPRFETRDTAPVVFGHISAPPGVYKVNAAGREMAGHTENFGATYLPFYSSNGWYMTNFGRQGKESQ